MFPRRIHPPDTAPGCQPVHNLAGPAVTFQNVSFSFPGSGPVLSDISFRIGPHAHVCLIGPNGGGKTTLLKLALGLLPPDEGRIDVFGRPPHRACRHVGYVPQHSVLKRGFPITVREVVLTGCVERHRFGWHRPSCGTDADAVMRELDLMPLSHHPFDRLSGGQRQRVLIARALVGNPSLLLLDEPTANIDPALGTQVRDILGRLSRRMTVMTVSHDLDYIDASLTSVLFVNRSVREMKPAEVTSDAVWSLYGRRPC